MPNPFELLPIRSVNLPHRVVLPMCEYARADGLANDRHLVRLGSRAVGGTGVVMTDDDVTTERPIGPADLRIWRDGALFNCGLPPRKRHRFHRRVVWFNNRQSRGENAIRFNPPGGWQVWRNRYGQR